MTILYWYHKDFYFINNYYHILHFFTLALLKYSTPKFIICLKLFSGIREILEE